MSTAMTVDAHRIVASPEALDRAVWPQWADVLRLAPDEAIVIHEIGADIVTPEVDDPHAIVEIEAGFAEILRDPAELLEAVARHVDWVVPSSRPAFVQGLVAGVPCKLWISLDGSVRLLCSTSHVHELEERLR